MKDYKRRENFEKILCKLNINDVKTAINNANTIIKNGNYEPVHYRKYTYYRNNPSTNLHEIIEQIFKKLGI